MGRRGNHMFGTKSSRIPKKVLLIGILLIVWLVSYFYVSVNSVKEVEADISSSVVDTQTPQN